VGGSCRCGPGGLATLVQNRGFTASPGLPQGGHIEAGKVETPSDLPGSYHQLLQPGGEPLTARKSGSTQTLSTGKYGDLGPGKESIAAPWTAPNRTSVNRRPGPTPPRAGQPGDQDRRRRRQSWLEQRLKDERMGRGGGPGQLRTPPSSRPRPHGCRSPSAAVWPGWVIVMPSHAPRLELHPSAHLLIPSGGVLPAAASKDPHHCLWMSAHLGPALEVLDGPRRGCNTGLAKLRPAILNVRLLRFSAGVPPACPWPLLRRCSRRRRPASVLGVRQLLPALGWCRCLLTRARPPGGMVTGAERLDKSKFELLADQRPTRPGQHPAAARATANELIALEQEMPPHISSSPSDGSLPSFPRI